MKTNWPTKKLGEICEIYQPQTITSNEIIKEGPFKVFGANGVIGYYSKYNHEDAEVLVTCRGATCGTLNMSEAKSWITGNAMVVHSKDEKVLLKSFLYYALKFSNLSKTITGTGQPQITRNSLAPFQIPLPPLKIQEQIVERMDKITEAQKLNDELIQKADELFQSLLHKELNPVGKDWEMKKLSDILDRMEYGISVKMQNNPPGVKILRMSNITNTRIDDTNIKYTEISPEEINKYRLFQGDVLINRVNSFELVGKTGIFKLDGDFVFASYLIRLRGKENLLNQDFLNYYLNSAVAVRQIRTRAKRAVSQANINTKDISKFKIHLPPLKTQTQIVAKLSAAQEYKKQLLEQKLKLKEFFDSVLHRSMNFQG